MQQFVPIRVLMHRLIKKWVYGVTIAAFVLVLPAMFIILILKNRMFNQSPIFSTSSGPSVFSCGSLGHPTTGFCEIAVRRSTYYLEISIARKKLKIHGWMYHSSQFFEVFSLLTSLIEVGNGFSLFTCLPIFGHHSQKWTTYNEFWALKSVTERCISENVEFPVYLLASKIFEKVLAC